MLDIGLLVFLGVILPILINVTTEHHFKWVKRYLRLAWTVVMIGFSLYLLKRPPVVGFAMNLHCKWPSWTGYLIFGVAGAALLAGYWWFTGRVLPPGSATPSADSDDDSQYKLLNLSPEDKATLDRLKAPLYKHKAALLDSPEYYKERVLKDKMRDLIDTLESQHGCLIDTDELKCLARPPLKVPVGDMDIAVTHKVVAEEMSKGRFWLVRDRHSKLRVPIVMFVSLTNHRPDPHQD